MPLTLELPPNLSRLLAAEAEKAGISMQEHATRLLALALFYRDAVTLLTHHALDTRHLLSTPECSANEQGNGEATSSQLAEALALLASIGYGEPTGPVTASAQTHSAMGKYAYLGPRSDAFARGKQHEIVRRADAATADQAIAGLKAAGLVERSDLDPEFWRAAGNLKATG